MTTPPWTTLLAAALALVAAWTPRAAEAQARAALFVGSNKAPPGMTELRYAHEDARKMRDVFVELGGVSPSRATLLLDPDVAQLRQAIDALTASSDSGQLILYYSGHADSTGLLLGDQRLPIADLRRFLATPRAQMRLAIVDACNSGAISRVKGGRLRPGVDIDWTADARVEGAVLVTSSAAEEASIERDDIGGSLFSHYLISGLRGAADSDEDSRVTLDEAFTYTSAHTLERSTQSRTGAQHPTYEYRISGERQVVLSWLDQPSYLSFGSDLAGAYLVFDRVRNKVVAELHKKPGERRRLWLPAGDYYIKKRLPTSVLLQKVALTKGAGFEVKDHKMHTVPYDEDVTKGHLSSVFLPTWRHGAPYLLNTAYTLRRDERLFGLLFAAYGVSDDVMLGTLPLLDVILTPNLLTRIRLAHNESLTWSVSMGFAQSFLTRVANARNRSIIVFNTESALSWRVSAPLTLTLLGGWESQSRPDTDSGDEWESQRLAAGLSATWYLTEHQLLQVVGRGYYTIPTTDDSAFNWGGELFYAYAWDRFRLGGGLGRGPEVNELGTLLTSVYPRVDLWWRW